jgi:hypothetical protein
LPATVGTDFGIEIDVLASATGNGGTRAIPVSVPFAKAVEERA